jgi:hypothetical protein
MLQKKPARRSRLRRKTANHKKALEIGFHITVSYQMEIPHFRPPFFYAEA